MINTYEIDGSLNRMLDFLPKFKPITFVFKKPRKEELQRLSKEIGKEGVISIFGSLQECLELVNNDATKNVFSSIDSDYGETKSGYVFTNFLADIFDFYYLIRSLDSNEQTNLFSSHFLELVQLKCYLIILLCVFDTGWSYLDYQEYFEKNMKSNDRVSVFYRGQTDFSYSLVPSLYRNIETKGIIDFSFIQRLYKENRISQKYENIYGSCDFSYDFMSYCQHALSYSPFIDFTKEKDIAMMFANHFSGNINKYTNTDSALFILVAKNENLISMEDELEHISIQYHANKLGFFSPIFNKPFWKCGLGDFDVKYKILTKETNDRMRYQKGLFFFPYKCVIANGVLLFPRKEDNLLKIRIPKEEKEKNCSDIIARNPMYSYDNLMDPYLFISKKD